MKHRLTPDKILLTPHNPSIQQKNAQKQETKKALDNLLIIQSHPTPISYP